MTNAANKSENSQVPIDISGSVEPAKKELEAASNKNKVNTGNIQATTSKANETALRIFLLLLPLVLAAAGGFGGYKITTLAEFGPRLSTAVVLVSAVGGGTLGWAIKKAALGEKIVSTSDAAQAKREKIEASLKKWISDITRLSLKETRIYDEIAKKTLENLRSFGKDSSLIRDTFERMFLATPVQKMWGQIIEKMKSEASTIPGLLKLMQDLPKWHKQDIHPRDVCTVEVISFLRALKDKGLLEIDESELTKASVEFVNTESHFTREEWIQHYEYMIAETRKDMNESNRGAKLELIKFFEQRMRELGLS